MIVRIDRIVEEFGVTKPWIYARTRDGALVGTGRGRKPKKGRRMRPVAQQSLPKEHIPHIKRGRLLFFDLDKVRDWFLAGERFAPEPSVHIPEVGPQATENASRCNA